MGPKAERNPSGSPLACYIVDWTCRSWIRAFIPPIGPTDNENRGMKPLWYSRKYHMGREHKYLALSVIYKSKKLRLVMSIGAEVEDITGQDGLGELEC